MHPLYYYIKKELSGFYPDGEASAMAKWTLVEVFHFTTLELYGGKDTNLSTDQQHRLEDILHRLQRYEPWQYIAGQTRFCQLPIRVAPGVLIPRPETEELVTWILQTQRQPHLRVLDIGTGSGCIALALAAGLPHPTVMAWDISPEALQIAATNAARNNVQIEFRQIDVMQDPLPDLKVDLIVSNPPYIREDERQDMEANVLDWEPSLALFVPNDDPLRFYRRIACIGRSMLTSGGALYVEINRRYGQEMIQLLTDTGYHNVELRRDLSGNDRMLKAINP